MQVLRTGLLVLTAVMLLGFALLNRQIVAVNLWPELGMDCANPDGCYFHFEWPASMLAITAFLIGLVPMWLVARATRWRLSRRIATLENALRAATPTPPLSQTAQTDTTTED